MATARDQARSKGGPTLTSMDAPKAKAVKQTKGASRNTPQFAGKVSKVINGAARGKMNTALSSQMPGRSTMRGYTKPIGPTNGASKKRRVSATGGHSDH